MNKFKKRVREHAEKHGMRYQAARFQLDENGPEGMRRKIGTVTDAEWRQKFETLFAAGERGYVELFAVEGLLDAHLGCFEDKPGPYSLPPDERDGVTDQPRDALHSWNRYLTGRRAQTKYEREYSEYELSGLIGEKGVPPEEVPDPIVNLLRQERDCTRSRVSPYTCTVLLSLYQDCHVRPETICDLLGKSPEGVPHVLYKLPPPDDETATEDPREAFDAWVQYANKLGDESYQKDVQLAGVSVAASGHAKGNNDAKPGMYGYSVPFDDVKALRKRHDELLGLVDALWQLLDDIDTASDVAKGDDVQYRRRVEHLQKQRWDTGVVADGYRVYIKGWPSERKGEWLDKYDPNHPAEGATVIDQIGPEIFAGAEDPPGGPADPDTHTASS